MNTVKALVKFGKNEVELNTECPKAIEKCGCLEVPTAVSAALEKTHLKFNEPIRWNHVLGCYTGPACGMMVGIETDGCIHS